MKKMNLSEIDLKNSFFHFDVRSLEYIEEYGFPPDIGPDSQNAEETPKVFFSKGIDGVLDIIDVWLIWRMHKDHRENVGWTKEFLLESYLDDIEKKNITFNNMYKWLLQRKYYKVDLEEGIDYKVDDIDEPKRNAIKNKKDCENSVKKPWDYLFAMQMYKGKIKHFDERMEDWNMHTISNKGISPNKISLLETEDGKTDALSVILDLYEINNNSNYRLLDEFVSFCKEKNIIDIKDKIENNKIR